jgi:release factor glutamine methyltransferase
VPRPETETLISAAVAHITERFGEAGAGCVVADIGTGSGCIAITLACQLPQLRVIAIDISDAALQVARDNAERHGVADRIDFRLGSWLEPLARETVHLLVSNPPYITTAEMAELPRDVAGFEPHTALAADDDGLGPYRSIASAMENLEGDCEVILEVDGRRADSVISLFPQATTTSVINDLSGRPRVVQVGR